MSRIEVRAEIAGNVARIEANVGDSVAEDDPILILDSMKMEIPVGAPAAGTVAEIMVAEGETVAEGQSVAVLQT